MPKKSATVLQARAVAAPLDALYVAPENARFGRKPENIDELAANIATYGLLTPLLAYEGDVSGGAHMYAIVAGARRLAALMLLRSGGELPARLDAGAIPLRLVDPAEAAAASLSENTQRVDLGVVDTALAFNRMTLDGRDIAEIAKAFGVTERFVKGRIKLAGLHEPILEALRAGDISLDVAQLYAGAHMARQEKVWKALGKQARIDWRVKEELKKNTLNAGDALARFVGEEAYLAAGGQIEQELFKAPELSRWLDPALAERLAQDKLKAAAAELEAEGFLFVEPAIQEPQGKYVAGNLGKPRKPTPEESARRREIDARFKAIAKEEREIDAASDKRDDPTYTDQEEARIDALNEEGERLRCEQDRIAAGLVTFDVKAKAKSGVVVTLDEAGALVVRRGVVAPKHRTAIGSRQPAAGKKGKAAAATPAKPEPQAPMTNLTHEKTSRIASAVVGRTLARAPSVALVAIAAALARAVFGEHEPFAEALDIPFRAAFEPALDLLSDKELAAAAKRWQVALGKDLGTLEARMIDWPQNDVLDLLAICVGAYVKVIEPNAARDYGDDDARARLATLGKLAGANPAAHFIPDAEYLNGLSRPSLDAAAAELGLDTAGAKTKTALAAIVADKAKGDGASAAWVPPLLRTLCGVAPLAVGKKKPGPPAPSPAKTQGKCTHPVHGVIALTKKSAKAPPKKAPVKKLSKPKPRTAAGARS